MIEKILSEIEKLIKSNEESANACYPSAMARESAYYECKEIVQEVEKDSGWIPVETELPKDFAFIYATCISLVDNREPWVIEGIYLGGFERMTPMLEYGDAKVIAWMPKKQLPAPYQKGE